MQQEDLVLTPAMRRIIALLNLRTPLSPKEIARDAFIALTTLEGGGYLKKMKSLGLIRVQGWLKNHNGFTTPLYAVGPGPDCPRPKFQAKDRDSDGMAKIVAVLKSHGSLDYREIAGLAGLSANTIKNAKYMEALVAQRRIHIAAWRRNATGHLRPIYRHGEGENAERPAFLTRQEISRRHRSGRKMLAGGDRSVKAQLQHLVGIPAA